MGAGAGFGRGRGRQGERALVHERGRLGADAAIGIGDGDGIGAGSQSRDDGAGHAVAPLVGVGRGAAHGVGRDAAVVLSADRVVDGEPGRDAACCIHHARGRGRTAAGIGHGHGVGAWRQVGDGRAGVARVPQVGVGRHAPAGGRRGAAARAVALGVGGADLGRQGGGGHRGAGDHAAQVGVHDGHAVVSGWQAADGLGGGARAPVERIVGRAPAYVGGERGRQRAVVVRDARPERRGRGQRDAGRAGGAVAVGHGDAVGACRQIVDGLRGVAGVPQIGVGWRAAGRIGRHGAVAEAAAGGLGGLQHDRDLGLDGKCEADERHGHDGPAEG